MQIRFRVIIESPFAGNVDRNINYARQCALHSLSLGEAPFASHLLYPQFLNDLVPSERLIGIEAGFAWWKSADLIAFYTDLGWSPGMLKARERLHEIIVPFTIRKILSKLEWDA